MNESAQFSPIAIEIVSRVIRSLQIKNYPMRDRHVINTDMVPKWSDRTQSPGPLRESPVHSQTQQIPEKLPLIKPLPTLSQKENPVNVNATVQSAVDYGKLLGLIRDMNITHLECLGPQIPVSVIKFGQKQVTNIILSEEEIKSFLAFISEKSKIPLAGGVFKVIVDGMLVNAIVSDEIGTKFMIKKNYQLPQ